MTLFFPSLAKIMIKRKKKQKRMKKGGVKEIFAYMQYVLLIVNKSRLPNLNLEPFHGMPKMTFVFHWKF
jgi:hypothetical protein